MQFNLYALGVMERGKVGSEGVGDGGVDEWGGFAVAFDPFMGTGNAVDTT